VRYLFHHAHPDDETLSTGAIILGLVSQGHTVLVMTATRGELGQAVPGSLPPGADLQQVRITERREALICLGAHDAGWLGSGPNRASGAQDRTYRDSGMEWITPTHAGPSQQAPPDSLDRANLEEVIADVMAAGVHHRADRLVSYDARGGYGHPDHVVCHRSTCEAAERLGLDFLEITADPTSSSQWFDESGNPRLLDAHRSYRSQFSLVSDMVIHVGGQRDRVLWMGGISMERQCRPIQSHHHTEGEDHVG